jgi:hypothetical protein
VIRGAIFYPAGVLGELSSRRRQLNVCLNWLSRRRKPGGTVTSLTLPGMDGRTFFLPASNCSIALFVCSYGQGDLEEGYTDEQMFEVDAIVEGYTPEQREVAIELAKALKWETQEEYDTDVDHSELRQQQRREQGRGI